MSQRFDFTSLELFVAVCEAKSIARAAEAAHIAPSAVSKRIAQMERLAGAALLVRSHAGVTPTRTGLTLLQHARHVLYNLDLIERDLLGDSRGAREHIRVFASASAISEFLPEVVASFLADPAHQNIDVDIEEMVSQEVVTGVRDGRAVLGVCWEDANTAGLESFGLRFDHLAAVVPRGHALASRRSIAFGDTLDYMHAGLRPSSSVTALLQRESIRAGKPIRFRVLVSTFQATLAVVSSGLVIAIVPSEIALPYASVANLDVVPLTDAWAQRRFSVCYRNRRTLPHAAALLTSYLLSQADPAAFEAQ